MTPTLDRDVAEAIYRLVGDFETRWILDFSQCDIPACNCGKIHEEVVERDNVYPHPGFIPLPTFSELVRILPKIGEKKEWSENGFWGAGYDITKLYMNAPSAEDGIKQVSEYLRKIL